MWLSRKGLVLAVIAVALGFAPAAAHATTIEQAIRIEATVPTERPPTRIEQAMRIAEAVATENLTALMKNGRGIEQAIRTVPLDFPAGASLSSFSSGSMGLQVFARSVDPATYVPGDLDGDGVGDIADRCPLGKDRCDDLDDDSDSIVGRDPKDPQPLEDMPTASFAGKLEIRGNDQLAVRLQAQAAADAD